MELHITWRDEDSDGYTSVLPEALLTKVRQDTRCKHVLFGPRRGEHTVVCNVSAKDEMVYLDYAPYETQNAEHHHLGILRLTFRDSSRTGTPEVAWKKNSKDAFRKLEPLPVLRWERAQIDTRTSPFEPSGFSDAKTKTLRAITDRRGQPKFRKTLRKAYEDKCAVTQCDVLDVLEAAHIIGYKGDQTNHVQNGLLLRADIHTLFDLHLLSIDPTTWPVVLQPKLLDGPYGKLHGTVITRPSKDEHCPNVEALRGHLDELVRSGA